MSPSTKGIRRLLSGGNRLVGSRVTLHAFGLPGIKLRALTTPFLTVNCGTYRACSFRTGGLGTRRFRRPSPGTPLIFVDRLLMRRLSLRARNVVRNLMSRIPTRCFAADSFLSLNEP